MNSWLPLLIFIVATILAWKFPRVMLFSSLVLIPTYVVKFTIGPLPTTLIELLIWATAVGWLANGPVANFKDLIKTLRPISWPLVLLGLGLIVGSVVSTQPLLSLGIIKGWFVDPIILFGLILVLCRADDVRRIVMALLFSTLPITVVALWQVVTGHFITIDGRASAWFASANYLALYLVPILLVGVGLLFDAKAKLMRWLYWMIAGFGLIAVYFAYSYGGWLGLIAGLLVLGVWWWLGRWQFWVSLGGVLSLAIATQINTPRVARMLDFKTQSSASVRLQIWATDWLMTKTHWLTGIGLGQYPTRYPEFVVKLFNPPLEAGMLHAHNLYFQFLLNLGIVGLIGFGWLVMNFFQTIKRAHLAWQAPLVASLVAILAHGLVDTPYWKSDLSLLFWVLLAVVYLASGPQLKGSKL